MDVYVILKTWNAAEMRILHLLIAASTLASAASAQDVVVMRRPIAPPRHAATTPATPDTTPAPAPAPAAPVHHWSEGDWTWAPGEATCRASAAQTRAVTCRDAADVVVADALCTATKPSAQRLVDRTDGCGYAWTEGAWSDEGACSPSSTGTRTVACVRSDGVDAPGMCGTDQPSARRSGKRLEGCSFEWTGSTWSDWTPGCGANASRTRTVQCQTGAPTPFVVDDAHCDGDKPHASEGPAAYYGSCTGHWDWTAWRPGSDCTDAQRTETRDPVCTTADGTDPTGAACDPTIRPGSDSRTASCLAPGETRLGALAAGERAFSAGGRFALVMRTDGVLAIEAKDGSTVWQVSQSTLQKIGSDAPGSMFNAQGDGNMVVYAPASIGGDPRWNSFTWGAPGGYAVIDDEGVLKVYHPDGRVLYRSTGASGADHHWNPFEKKYVP